MTLIAALKLHDVPILLGDLLISSPHSDTSHAKLPTLLSQEVDQVLPRDEYYPIVRGLQRKVARINDWLVVAWAGNLIAAKVVLKKMVERFKSKRVPREKVFTFLSQVDDLGTIECTIIGWLADKTGIVSFSWNSATRHLSVDEGPYIEGSGKQDFEKNVLGMHV